MEFTIFGILLLIFGGSLTIYLKFSSILRERIVDQYSAMASSVPNGRSWTSLSIIVPVYNEENTILDCAHAILNALQDFHGGWELIFIDDDSTDSSPQLLKEFITVFGQETSIKLLNSGRHSADKRFSNWVGKSLPCHVGYRESAGDYLLFLDADVRLDQAAVRNLLTQIRVDDTEFLSVIPKAACNSWYSSAFYPLSMICQILAFDYIKNNPENSYPSASGQVMLFERNAYETMGGFEALSDNVSQDVRAAKNAKKAGIRQKHILGFNLAYMVTDTTFLEMVKSFSKSILVAVEHDIPKVLVFPLIMIMVTCLPYCVVLFEFAELVSTAQMYALPRGLSINLILSVSTIMVHAFILHQFLLMLENRSKAVCLYPTGALIFLAISCHALFTHYWGNKKYWKWKDRRIVTDG